MRWASLSAPQCRNGRASRARHARRWPGAPAGSSRSIPRVMPKRALELGYRRYEWKCDSLNAPSRAAAQRLGFSYEGTFRQASVYKGRSRDTAWYAMIDKEWPELERAFRRWLDPGNFDAQGRQRERLGDLTGPILKQ